MWQRIAVSILLVFCCSCSTELDKKQARVRQDFGNTCQLFGAAALAREKAITTFSTSAFATKKSMIEREWKDWLDSHTDASGNLVSKRPDGTIGPMPVKQLAEAMTLRGDALLKLAIEQKDFADKQEQYVGAIHTYLATVTKISQDDANIQDAKETAQAAFNQVLGTLTGIATSAGIMIPLAF